MKESLKYYRRLGKIIFASAIFFSFFIISSNLSGQMPINYYSIQEGDFTQNENWSRMPDGADCNCNPGCTVGNNETVYIENDMSTPNCVTIEVNGTGVMIIRDSSELTINSGSGLTGDGDIQIERGSKLIVDGNLDLSGNSSLDVQGVLEVTGDVTLGGNAGFSGIGGVTIGGCGCENFSGPGNCNENAGCIVLPVELAKFEGEYLKGEVNISWTTAIEINNDYFEVERSVDGMAFESVGIINGNGNSQEVHKYDFRDRNPVSGTLYYRLKTVDYDGSYEYSELTSVKVSSLNIQSLNVYPNPAVSNNGFNIEYEGEPGVNPELLIVVYDITGREIFSKVIIQETNGVLMAIDPSEKLKAGIYFVIASKDQEMVRQKLIVTDHSSSSNSSLANR